MKSTFNRVLVIGSLVIMATACGGGGGGSSDDTSGGGTTLPTDGSVAALEIGQQVSLVTTDTSSSSNLVRALRNLEPATGDYVTDEPQIYVYDRSMEALDIINEILCFIDKTGYNNPLVVNQGAYTATFDASSCTSRDEDHSSSGTGQSSGQTVDPETWTVNVTRASNTSAQIVNFWVPDEYSGGKLHVKLTITEGRSESNPFGTFSMDFQSASLDDVVNDIMSGNLSVSETSNGQLDLQFTESENGGSKEIHAIISPNGEAGEAYVTHSFSGEGFGDGSGDGTTGTAANSSADGGTGDFEGGSFSESIDIAFDADHYLADYGDETECMDTQNFDEFVWQYNLYNPTTGARKDLNSGFPVHAGDYWGWVGYYGVWFDEAANITNGSTVTDDDGTAYTVFEGAGRLVRRTRHTIELSELVGDRFSYWDNDSFESVMVELLTAADANIGGQPEGTLVVVKIGAYVCGENGCNFEDTDAEVIDFGAGEWAGLWKDGFGSVNLIANDDGFFTSDMSVAYYSQEYVMPNDEVFAGGDLQLQCVSNCLKPELSVEDLSSNDPYLPMDWSEPEIHVYSFDADNYVLQKDGEDVAIDVGGTVDPGSYYSWGVSSGDMVTTNVVLENTWDIWDQDVTYYWETGPERWSHLVSIKTADNNFVEFESELRCLLDRGDEGLFVLNYAGAGNLWGIPWEQQDGEANEYNWRPAFTLENGTELDCDGETYVTKAMAKELIMQSDDLSECADLDTGNIDPRTNEFTEPEIGADPCSGTECQTLELLIE